MADELNILCIKENIIRREDKQWGIINLSVYHPIIKIMIDVIVIIMIIVIVHSIVNLILFVAQEQPELRE